MTENAARVDESVVLELQLNYLLLLSTLKSGRAYANYSASSPSVVF